MSISAIPLHWRAAPTSRITATTKSLRLGLMLARDEQARPRPTITLPRLDAGLLADPPRILELAPPADLPRREPATIAVILKIVARHFDVPVVALVGHRCRRGSRPLALSVALAVAKTATGATYAQVENALDAAAGSGWDSVSRVRHLRSIDRDLDRTIQALEAELGLAR